MSKNAYECGEIMERMSDAHMMKTVIEIDPFYPKLVNEFIVNLSARLNYPNSPDFRKVHVKG